MNCVRRLFALVLFAATAGAAMAATIIGDVPQFYRGNQPFTVSITAAPDTGTVVQAIEDAPPAGWTVGAISHGGAFDSATGKVKWGPFTDANSRVLTYEITPPSGATGEKTFAGTAVFDSASIVIGGSRTTKKFPGALVRNMPSDYLPGAAVAVTIDAAPASGVNAWALEELVPANWIVSSISHGGSFDAANRRIKWGPFFDATDRSLTYSITPPSSSRIDATLTASARFDEASLTDTGALPLRASQLTRTIPSTYVPLTEFQVALTAAPASYVQILTLEENVPTGWTPTAISAGGIWDSANRKIKWGPMFGADVTHSDFSYKLTPASDASAPLTLNATAVFDEKSVTSSAVINRFLAHTANTVVRTLPPNYKPAQALTVTIDATPIDTSLVYAIEENVPANWIVANISSGGAFDSANRRVKWGPFFDSVATARRLTYQLTPPAAAFGVMPLAGAGDFDSQVVTTSGDTSITNAPPVVTRSLPPRYNPGLAMTVTLNASPVPGILTYAIEEQVPTGWTISAISDGGAYDSVNKKLKWGPFIDANLRPLTYTITPPPSATGTNNFSGEGFFNGDSFAVSGAAAVPPNRAPVALSDTFNRPATATFKVSVFALLANDSDADADSINVVSFNPQSDRLGTVELIWPWIYYTAPVGNPIADTFTYTVADNFGGSASAQVTLIPTDFPNAAAQNIVAIEIQSNGSALIRFAGVPGFTYHIQTSPDLAGWNSVADRVANSIGLFEYTDSGGGPGSTRFFRTLWP